MAMNEILVVGSVALDSVKTPFGEVKEALGGSATYASYSGSFFAPIRMVAVVGEDFPTPHIALLEKRGIQTDGLQTVKGRTFRWSGKYEYDLNEAHTLATELNVFEHFKPTLSEAYKKSPFVFLANIDPELQLSVLDQIEKPQLVACDTMNLWIKLKPEALRKVIKRVDFLFMNDAEARQFTNSASLVKAGRMLQSWGPKSVVIKKGEHGALLFGHNTFFSAPAFPLEEVYDPTGAGDTFAGGFFGYVAKNQGDISEKTLRKAVVYGSAMASFTVEKFSLERLTTLTVEQIEARVQMLKELAHFDIE
jgi:sugar/nucleoside kinase (ribokinase family)